VLDQQAAAQPARRPVVVQRQSCALLGILAEQAQGFLPHVMEFFKSKLKPRRKADQRPVADAARDAGLT